MDKSDIDKFKRYYKDDDKELARALYRLEKDAEQLENREECPLCGQSINRKEVSEFLKLVRAERKKLDEKMQREYEAGAPERERKARERDIAERKWKADVEAYIISHSKDFARLARLWRSGKEISLPSIPDDEKKTWNFAIEIWAGGVASREDILMNIEEFQFDI